MTMFDSKTAPIEILKTHHEPMPEWLRDFAPGDSLSLLAFMNSRTVLIPNIDTDALKLFARAEAAHCFIYCHHNGGVSFAEKALQNPVFGISQHYTKIAEMEPISDLPDLEIPRSEFPPMQTVSTLLPSECLRIYERKASSGPENGPERIAVCALDIDRCDTYIRLYHCGTKPPYAVVLEKRFYQLYEITNYTNQDVLKTIADFGELPQWLLATTGSEWDGYTKVSRGIRGGYFRSKRFLWQRI
ncbi:hypothetical protein FRD01_22930 [Microvenator marinus]|uniref:Uncharacterized protein n=1 Tax=Microvenator marinus TaxID=2600177 RepID=A0A5B8XWR1_9DELT|nr:hypothetical protein [Microvenator marinus]QED30035.1 hypothetical protein FRD01_22930 [Microvenator marinus]